MGKRLAPRTLRILALVRRCASAGKPCTFDLVERALRNPNCRTKAAKTRHRHDVCKHLSRLVSKGWLMVADRSQTSTHWWARVYAIGGRAPVVERKRASGTVLPSWMSPRRVVRPAKGGNVRTVRRADEEPVASVPLRVAA